MRKLKNWDNNTWLSSKKYILNFNKFLKKKVKLSNQSQILDIGCGRANIISDLQKKYNFKNKATGIDLIKNKNIKKNIIFKNINAIDYLKNCKKKYDLILIKQAIHFFPKKKLITLLNLIKKNLNLKGTLLIFSLKIKNNKIPCFKKMKMRLDKSLKKDKFLFKIIEKNLGEVKETNFNYKVIISKKKYVSMIKSRYISCLLDISREDLSKGIGEINLKFKNQIRFTDTLKCLSFRK
mgnify:FL=1|tara:strand:+ start:27 stop:737 length:711 start_codon:yes stop_codon:yes gene_type:complete